MSDAMPDLSALAEKWGSAFVARKDVGEFTGGLVSPGTVANADSQGAGPEGAIRIGRNVGYPVDSFVLWLGKRVRPAKIDMSRARAAKRPRKRRQG